MTTTATRTFTSAEVCKLAGITYRQLDHWCRKEYLRPLYRDQLYRPILEGRYNGYPRIWPPLEAAKAIALAGMLQAGITHAKAVELILAGRTATLVTRELRDAVIDDLPPDSRPHAVIVRGAL